jgi:hypothetical protein
LNNIYETQPKPKLNKCKWIQRHEKTHSITLWNWRGIGFLVTRTKATNSRLSHHYFHIFKMQRISNIYLEKAWKSRGPGLKIPSSTTCYLGDWDWEDGGWRPTGAKIWGDAISTNTECSGSFLPVFPATKGSLK